MISREEENGVGRDVLLELFEYKDGCLYRLGFSSWYGPKKLIGQKVGRIRKDGRMDTTIRDKPYLIHRLIWIWHNGYIPFGYEVDHIDKNPLNNKIENLRLSSKRENLMNNKRCKTSFPGVYFINGKKPWAAKIYYNGSLINIGSFFTLEEAVEARRKAKRDFGIEVREEFHQTS